MSLFFIILQIPEALTKYKLFTKVIQTKIESVKAEHVLNNINYYYFLKKSLKLFTGVTFSCINVKFLIYTINSLR